MLIQYLLSVQNENLLKEYSDANEVAYLLPFEFQ